MNPGPESTEKLPFYTWQPPQKPVTIHLHFDVVDRMLLEVMKGFGAVPRRGAEVGGFLLGNRTQAGDQLTVEILQFEPIACEHAEGPSFVLSANDLRLWNEAIARLRANGQQIVGFYRSHTRDGLHLAKEDLALLGEYFPDRDLVSLIIKPYATRASVAGFFFWEGESLRSDSPYLEFPFRRKELGGGVSPLDRAVSAARFGQSSRPPSPAPLGVQAGDSSSLASIPIDLPPGAPPSEAPKPKAARGGWVWIPLSFIFMLLGVILGFQIAISMRPRTPANPYLEAWSLALGVQRLDDRLVVSWDRTAPAVRNANRGVMTILAGDDSRRIELSYNDLQAGQLIYRSSPETVMFRLEVFPKDRTSIAETLEYRQPR
ncbi:MAG: hypothetical protein ACK58M_09640 [Acidobacteriota bacterium]|nr:hypothetical protein [Bryobacteraceae bacterium CoA2 C42]